MLGLGGHARRIVVLIGVCAGLWLVGTGQAFADPMLGQIRGHKYDAQQLDDRMGVSVDDGTGNLLVSATDLSVAGGLGPDLEIGRTYNSMFASGFSGLSATNLAGGWTMDTGYDVRLTTSGSDVLVKGPSGYQVRYTPKTGGGYNTPVGFDNVLATEAGGGWVLTDNASQTRQHFASNGTLTRLEDRNGRQISFTYTGPGGKLSSITDAESRTTTFAYDANGLMTTMTDSAGRVDTYGYTSDASGLNLTTYTDASGGITHYYYAPGGQIYAIVTPTGRTTQITYYPTGDPNAGKVKTLQRVTSTGPGCTGSWVFGVCLGTTYTIYYGPTTTFAYPSSTTTTVTDPIGTDTTSSSTDHVTTYTFDSNKKVTKINDALGRDQSLTYSANANVNTYFAPYNASTSGSASVTLNYDSDGNVAGSSQLVGGSAGPLTTTNTYNDAGMVPSGTAGAAYLRTTATDEGGVKRYGTYDANGNLTKNETRHGSVTSMSAVLHYASGAPGKLDYSEDGNGNRTTYGYDSAGNVSSITPPAPMGAQTFSYSGAGGKDLALSRVTTLSLPNSRSESYLYDAMDRVTKITYGDGSSVTNTYDLDGNLTQRTDTVDGTTYYVYDLLNRITNETYADTHTNAYTYDVNGNLLTSVDADGTTTFTYDDINRQTSIQEPGISTTTTVTYANASSTGVDQRVTTALPNSVKRINDYDMAGRMIRTCAFSTTFTDCPTTASQRLFSLTYDYSGTSISLCGATQGKEQISSETDQTGFQRQYCYWGEGTLQRAHDSTGEDWSYVYDPAGNLQSTAHQPISGSTVRTYYAYNADNQMCTFTDNSGLLTSPTPCSFTPGTHPSYDANGNELQAPTRRTNSVYNARNQLTRATDPAGNTWTNGYAGSSESERTYMGLVTGSGEIRAVERENALGLDQVGNTFYTRDTDGSLVSQHDATSRQYFLTDALGTPRVLLNTSGTVASTITYDPYGNPTHASAPYSRFGLAGGEFDALGIYHFGQRYYDPTLARWTQPDSLLHVDDVTQSNRYQYAADDPINLTDPEGTTAPNPCGPAGRRNHNSKGICRSLKRGCQSDCSVAVEVFSVVACTGVGVLYVPAGAVCASLAIPASHRLSHGN